MSVQDLETAVTRLSKEELTQFSKWFEEYVTDELDRQIEADILAGRFDATGKRAKADYEAGRCTSFCVIMPNLSPGFTTTHRINPSRVEKGKTKLNQ